MAKRKDLKLLVVSLYELDRELGERESATLLKDTKLLLGYYYDFLDVFLKEALDQLPPSRSYDYKIELEKPASKLSYSPF